MNALKSKPASHPDADAPVDIQHLRRFTLDDRGLELEILGLFAGQLPITIAALRNAASLKDWGIAAHTLKGSARAVGAWSIADLAEAAERLTALPDTAGRERLAQGLEEATAEVQGYIAALRAAD